jgi:hypothetical protein
LGFKDRDSRESLKCEKVKKNAKKLETAEKYRRELRKELGDN